MTDRAAYIRYSSHAQDLSTSVELQREAIRRAAGECVEYLDQARTGRAMAGRTALRQMLDDAEAGRLGKVYVYKYDRLGRDLAEAALVVRQLEDAGVEVTSCTEGNDPLARGVQLVVAEHYSRVLSERTRAGQLARHRQGAWTGGPAPYGYHSQQADGAARLVIDPGAAENVRWIFGRYVGGWGMKRMAAALNKRRLPSPRGRFWTHSTVHAMLHNEVYIGRLAFGRRRGVLNRATGHRRFIAAEPSICNVPELRIISDKMWNAARELQAQKYTGGKPRGRGQMRPLTGLAYCPACQAKLWVQSSKNSKGRFYYLECSRRRTSGDTACANGDRVREDAVVANMLDRLMRSVRFDGRMAEMSMAAALRRAREHDGDAEGVRSRLAELQRKAARLVEIVADETTDADGRRLLLKQMGDVERERRLLQEQASHTAATPANLAAQLRGEISRAFARLQAGLERPDSDRLNAMFRAAFGEVAVHGDGTWQPLAAIARRPVDDSSDIPTTGGRPRRRTC
jgi:site-specific DNA recombinase